MKLGRVTGSLSHWRQWQSAGCPVTHLEALSPECLEAPWKGWSRGVTRPTIEDWTVEDVGSVGGGCHSETAHACHARCGAGGSWGYT